MREFTDRELFLALQHARSLDENTGRRILEQFQIKQPALAQTLLGVFPSVIAQQQIAMSHHFMDLCFDLICIFEHILGPLPDQATSGKGWIEQQARLLNSELQAMMKDPAMANKIRDSLQNRFMERLIEDQPQSRLNQLMDEAVSDFAHEQGITGQAVTNTATALFVSIRLLNSVYAASTSFEA